MSEEDGYLGMRIAAVLRRHEVPAHPAMVAELVHVAVNDSWWDDAQVCTYVESIVPASVRTWCSRERVRRRVLARSDDVVRAQRNRPGKGNRRGERRG